jgi:hypothetical protein
VRGGRLGTEAKSEGQGLKEVGRAGHVRDLRMRVNKFTYGRINSYVSSAKIELFETIHDAD